MQTVTFVLEGAIEHRDHTGAHGVLGPGDVQWMTAGRGVLHSEMPHGDGAAHTLQLWLNLPARMKMTPARYQDQRLAEVPVHRTASGEARVYSGRSGSAEHGHGSTWPMWLVDLKVGSGGTWRQEVPAEHRGFVYVLGGSAAISSKEAGEGDVVWFEPEAGDVELVAREAFRGLLVSAPPIDEPVVAYGPFVMNTAEEIRQAFIDYQAGRLVAAR